jgi:hypothetical protein
MSDKATIDTLTVGFMRMHDLYMAAEDNCDIANRLLLLCWNSDELPDSLGVPIKAYFDTVGIRYDAK